MDRGAGRSGVATDRRRVRGRADGSLNRAWLAERVFYRDAAPGARERLDDIEHPLIYAEAARMERRNPGAKVIVHECRFHRGDPVDSVPIRSHRHGGGAGTDAHQAHGRDARMTERQAADRIRSQSSTAERRGLPTSSSIPPPDPRHAGAGRWAVSPVEGSLNHSPVKGVSPAAPKRT